MMKLYGQGGPPGEGGGMPGGMPGGPPPGEDGGAGPTIDEVD